jgi:putative PIG3 family NAD(P)H quinone oxidoreductase
MTESMRLIAIRDGKGGADALYLDSAPTPAPGPDQVLIRVRAAGVNRPDILQRLGLYPPPPGAPETLGLEVAGEIADVGPGVERWKKGEPVCALLPGGGYAEYAVADAGHVLPIPAGLDFVSAAGLPETVFTVWTNVFERGRLKSSQTLLVHGANSGIGATAIQMARAAGARVLATARGATKAARALEIGADVAIDAARQDWVPAIKAAGNVDVVLDMIGADYFQGNLEVLAADGRLVIIAFLTGKDVQLDLRQLMQKRLTVTGSTLRAREVGEKSRLARAVETNVWPWIEKGALRVPVDRTFALHQAGAAHAWLESGSQFGKVILTVD